MNLSDYAKIPTCSNCKPLRAPSGFSTTELCQFHAAMPQLLSAAKFVEQVLPRGSISSEKLLEAIANTGRK